MNSFTYSADLWPAFISTVLVALLGWYGWRRRSVPGALPFTIACLFAILWSVGAVLETAAQDPAAKIWWLKFQTLWQLPVIASATCFVLEFAGLGRWVTRRLVIALAVPMVVLAAFVLTNGVHALAWTEFLVRDGGVQPVRGPVLRTGLAYSYLLGLVNIGVLVRLLLTSPRYRWAAALMLTGQLSARVLFEMRMAGDFPDRWDADPFVLVALFSFYGVALFRFHVFDPVSAARSAVIDQMLEGMVVLDLEGRIVDLNAAAERMLGVSDQSARGRRVEEVLPGEVGGCTGLGDNGPAEWDLDLGTGASMRHYSAHNSLLKDPDGSDFGRLLLLHDVTERKKAQARLVEQEGVVAALRERQLLARELHDGVCQVLGYVSLQAESGRKRLHDGEGEKTDAMLARLAEVAQYAHGELRQSIFHLTAGSSENWSFLPSVERCLEDYRVTYGLETQLVVGQGLSDSSFSPQAGAQLLRVIQEAVNNSRKHAGSCTVRVSIERQNGQARIRVTDNGCGFDLTRLEPDRGHFGLAFMRERMVEIGGSVQIESEPGTGTRVDLAIPIHHSEGDV